MMTAQRTRSVGLMALSFSMIAVLSGGFVSGASVAGSTDCKLPDAVGNGACDVSNNNEECGYDGGDCCECTCIVDSLYPCDDELVFECLDPNAPCRGDGPNFLDVVEDEFMAFAGSYEFGPCTAGLIGNGECDLGNNNEECGYDGGDCCECTCIIDSLYPCDDELVFECLDPNAPCRGDGPNFLDVVENEFMAFAGSYEFGPCTVGLVGDGECDLENNNEECGYDGGDCCECTCASTPSHDCGDAGFTCVDPTSGCALVEAGTVTTVSASANAYDVRPGAASMGSGCMVDGCSPALTRDGITADGESRWSCSPTIVAGGGLCEIEFTFDTPQDIKEVQVAFWQGGEGTRTLEATINGEVYGMFDSYPGSVFNSFGVEGNGVRTLALTSVGATAQEWISLLEVRFMIEA